MYDLLTVERGDNIDCISDSKVKEEESDEMPRMPRFGRETVLPRVGQKSGGRPSRVLLFVRNNMRNLNGFQKFSKIDTKILGFFFNVEREF